jgi:outer membrane protein assembly factor BamE (lipoprotein component of BamABCDE complex)
MKNTKTMNRLLTIVIAASAMSLAACGGGSSSSDPASVLPAGAIGTVGDGVNASEYAALKCGMNKDQVQAIIGDLPTFISSDNVVWNYIYPTNVVQVAFPSGVLTYKVLFKGNTNVDSLKC